MFALLLQCRAVSLCPVRGHRQRKCVHVSSPGLARVRRREAYCALSFLSPLVCRVVRIHQLCPVPPSRLFGRSRARRNPLRSRWCPALSGQPFGALCPHQAPLCIRPPLSLLHPHTCITVLISTFSPLFLGLYRSCSCFPLAFRRTLFRFNRFGQRHPPLRSVLRLTRRALVFDTL